MLKASYYDPPPSGPLSSLFRYWAYKCLDPVQMESRLKDLIRAGAIEVTPLLPWGQFLEQANFEFLIKTSAGRVSAGTFSYRILQGHRAFGFTKPAPVTSKVQGQHKPPDTAMAEAAALIKRIKDYQKAHEVSQRKALDDLHQDLGHNSSNAAKTALHRARDLLAGK